MKIAVYLSGQARHLDNGGVWNSISNLFNEHEVDFYFHFWNTKMYSRKHILDQIQPKEYKFEPQINFTPRANYILKQKVLKRKLPFKGYFNMLSFYYSFAQAKTIIPVNEYDFIFKSRTDMFFDNELNHLVQQGEKRLLVDPFWNKRRIRLSDFCFFGNPEVFSKLLDCAELATQPEKYLNDYAKRMNRLRLTSHRYIRYAYDHFRVNFEPVPMQTMLLRPPAKGTTFESIAKETIKDKKELYTQLLLLNFPDKRKWISREIKRQRKQLRDTSLLM